MNGTSAPDCHDILCLPIIKCHILYNHRYNEIETSVERIFFFGRELFQEKFQTYRLEPFMALCISIS